MKVVPIYEVEPLPGWALECEHGHQAKDKTPEGRLVRLATVVRWIQSEQGLPRSEAVQRLCSVLDDRVLAHLYFLQLGDFASPVAVNSRFGFKVSPQVQTSAQRSARTSFVVPDYLSSYIGRPSAIRAKATAAAPPAVPLGLPALLARLRNDWRPRHATKAAECDPLDDKRSWAAYLSVPLAVAHELWGWGDTGVATVDGNTCDCVSELPEQVRGYDDLLKVRGAVDSPDWTPDMLRVLMAEEAARKGQPGAKGVRASLASELGLSVQRVGQLIATAREIPEEVPKLRPGSSVFNIA